MKTRCILFIALVAALSQVATESAAVDMQAHIYTQEAQQAYSTFRAKQSSYYTGNYTYSKLANTTNDELFGALNTLMGNTCRIASGFSYDKLRSQYVKVDRDLNRSGYIIGYYDGQSINGTWDSGKTWNREHTWPQSKGANKSISMGHDMQSVRPASTSVNSNRGNTAYGESGSYYDPDEVRINNSYYVSSNLGTYRGDAARVILYDYIVYGGMGSHKNSLYNGNAQLLSKLGSSGVFESLRVLLKWHMQDPPSLTEMVRNDGAQDYQGNRNPFIDFPELAIQVFANNSGIQVFDVSCNSTETLAPNYRYTLSDGFIAYLTDANGLHPNSVSVNGAHADYNPQNGRLTITNVTSAVRITTDTPNAVEEVSADGTKAIYTLSGQLLLTTDDLPAAIGNLASGVYILRANGTTRKIVVR